MKVNRSKSTRAVSEGQIWKTAAADIEIVGLGKRLIHYRVTKQFGPREVSAQISEIQAMENYLKTNRAELAKRPSAN